MILSRSALYVLQYFFLFPIVRSVNYLSNSFDTPHASHEYIIFNSVLHTLKILSFMFIPSDFFQSSVPEKLSFPFYLLYLFSLRE